MLNFCPGAKTRFMKSISTSVILSHTEVQMRTLTMVRGISGSGKTTLARQLALGGRRKLIAADDYFVEDGVYQFDPSRLPHAHAYCQEAAEKAMQEGLHVIVHNTFTCRWEMEPYLQMGERHGYRTTVVSIYDGGCTNEELVARNEHGTPLDAIKAMRQRWEHDWKNGDVLPPWER
jgi:predicted kinase